LRVLLGNTIALTERQRDSGVEEYLVRDIRKVASVGDGGSNPSSIVEEIFDWRCAE
jgi:hypothetical protein